MMYIKGCLFLKSKLHLFQDADERTIVWCSSHKGATGLPGV